MRNVTTRVKQEAAFCVAVLAMCTGACGGMEGDQFIEQSTELRRASLKRADLKKVKGSPRINKNGLSTSRSFEVSIGYDRKFLLQGKNLGFAVRVQKFRNSGGLKCQLNTEGSNSPILRVRESGRAEVAATGTNRRFALGGVQENDIFVVQRSGDRWLFVHWDKDFGEKSRRTLGVSTNGRYTARCWGPGKNGGGEVAIDRILVDADQYLPPPSNPHYLDDASPESPKYRSRRYQGLSDHITGQSFIAPFTGPAYVEVCMYKPTYGGASVPEVALYLVDGEEVNFRRPLVNFGVLPVKKLDGLCDPEGKSSTSYWVRVDLSKAGPLRAGARYLVGFKDPTDKLLVRTATDRYRGGSVWTYFEQLPSPRADDDEDLVMRLGR